ncbi:hypothetical protein ASE26_07025 [Duganella sp. Root198D2]|nr:hypothetical protein ASD07_22825 [Duganella sp. Root336D2]KRB87148.1 hypothetical protein ASE26_07025 [Duganella sp. Root198D2]
MDIVTLGIRCGSGCLAIVREKLRAFFDGADCQVHYEEASCVVRVREMIDPKAYPAVIEDCGYRHEQQVHYNYG